MPYKTPRTCELCGGAYIPSHAPQRFCSPACANRASARLRSGENNANWRGDEAGVNEKRGRAQRRYSLAGKECAQFGCDAPAAERHHVDGDTGNNEPENLMFLCHYHHMEIDGRLAAFVAQASKRGEDPCTNCEQERGGARSGLCRRCYRYRRDHGTDRPAHLWEGK